MILGLKTDGDVAELVLHDYERVVSVQQWTAGRTLAEGLLQRIRAFLADHDLAFQQLEGLVVFSGPGSFTSLRIGAVVANTVAYAESLPIVGTNGDDWLIKGARRLAAGESDYQVIPEYGAEPRITKPGRHP
jgi:tRNA threonylcarbamoyladenosine biosynthesis protein TsaB